MRRAFALFAVVLCGAVPGLTQSRLPSPEHALIVAPPYASRATTTSPYDLTFTSGTRITVPREDVHELATSVVRSALAQQASSPVSVGSLLVLHIRQRMPRQNER